MTAIYLVLSPCFTDSYSIIEDLDGEVLKPWLEGTIDAATGRTAIAVKNEKHESASLMRPYLKSQIIRIIPYLCVYKRALKGTFVNRSLIPFPSEQLTFVPRDCVPVGLHDYSLP